MDLMKLMYSHVYELFITDVAMLALTSHTGFIQIILFVGHHTLNDVYCSCKYFNHKK